MNKKSKNASILTTSSEPATATLRLVLKVPDFGSRWGVKKDVVWKWLKVGMPHLKISRRNTQIPLAEADAWVKQNFLRQREG